MIISKYYEDEIYDIPPLAISDGCSTVVLYKWDWIGWGWMVSGPADGVKHRAKDIIRLNGWHLARAETLYTITVVLPEQRV